ncbi:MAG: hypothetical protein KF764_10085 [Labilithrix sp.]|nr:hypothetical protein [Labilithrix sp.]
MSQHPGAPPPGGFGAPQPYGYPQGQGAPPSPNKTSTGVIIAIVAGVVLLVLVGIVGVLAVLGIYGTRKYIANAKTAEARNAVSMMARDAVSAYEETDDPSAEHELCPSARAPVPASIQDVSARKYMSSSADWSGDPGFSCLGFEMSAPQYYQYDYKRIGAGFTAIARGDLNGDGVASSFELEGHVQGDTVVVASSIKETNPEE